METCIRKAVRVNITGFKSKMNLLIGDSKTRVSKCKFPIDVYTCGLKNKC